MSKLDVIIKNVGSVLQRNAPALLVAAGTASVCTAVGLTVRNTVKAMAVLDDIHEELPDDVELDRRGIIKATWKLYIPPLAALAVGLGCFIASNKVMSRRNAAIASAYSIADRALREYDDKVRELVGEEKRDEIKEAIAQDRLNKDGVTMKEVFLTSKGEHLCYDVLSGRYFKSDMESLRAAANELNHMLIHESYTSLNTFYGLLGLEATKMGGDLGWTSDDLVDFSFTAKVADNGEPCIVMDYSIEPKADYYRNIL